MRGGPPDPGFVLNVPLPERLYDAADVTYYVVGGEGAVRMGGQETKLATNAFVSASFKRSQLGIDSPDGSSTPDHDRTDQGQAFVYLDHILSPSDRVSFIGGYSNQTFPICNQILGKPRQRTA